MSEQQEHKEYGYSATHDMMVQRVGSVKLMMWMLYCGNSGNNDVDVEECGRSGTNETDDVEYDSVSHGVAIHFA
jgi:hypothetical protein